MNTTAQNRDLITAYFDAFKDLGTNSIVLRGHEGAVYAVGINANNHWAVTGSWDGTARLWDLSAKDPSASPIVLRGHESTNPPQITVPWNG